jgi:pimeloyl-ACP methyl ester carboxylesterase
MKQTILLSFLIFFSCSLFSQFSVTIPNGAYPLEATLTLPPGAGPHPLIIMVHGSGANDRDQTLHITGGNSLCLYPGIYNDTVRNFRDFADAFRNEGIATLRYDKRTFTYPTQLNPQTITPYDFVDDVHAAIDYAKQIPNVDSSCIILLGHSQGATLIPIVAQQRNDIASLLALGTGARGIDTLYSLQIRELYYRCLRDTATGDLNFNQLMASFQQIRNGTWNPNMPFQGAFPTFWEDWMDITDSVTYNFGQLSQPTLFLHGNDDFNIPIEDAQIIDRELTASNFDLYYLNGINHFFTTAIQSQVAPMVIDSIVNWLNINKFNNTSVDKSSLLEEVQIRVDQDRLEVKSKDGKLLERVYLTDLQGKLLINQQNTSQVQIGTGSFPKGVYVLGIQKEGKQLFRKIAF